jgi:uncharacterized membrane protein YhaH (DUF805 family)
VNDPARKYWFPAKRYGWGWGPPVTWQGWVFLIVWVIVLVGAAPFVRPHQHPALYALFAVVMVAIMLAVCYAKGEPPRWRWGNRPRPK